MPKKSKSKKSQRKQRPNKTIEQLVHSGLKQKADLFDQRGKVYGRNYLNFGHAMKGIFPDGITLKTADDFIRFGLFVQMIAKATRYGNQFKDGHPDSLDDNTVYSQMLRAYDTSEERAMQ